MKIKNYYVDIVLYLGPFVLELLGIIINNLTTESIINYMLWVFYSIVIIGIWRDLSFDSKYAVFKKIICTLVLVLTFSIFRLPIYLIIVGIWRDKKLRYKLFPLRMIASIVCLVVTIVPDWNSFVKLFDYNFWMTASSLEVFMFWYGVSIIGIVLLIIWAVHAERTMAFKRSNVDS